MVQWCSGRWPRTKISEDVKHTFAWTIERFSERQEPNSQFLWSSKFTIRGPDDLVTHWKMKLYPKVSQAPLLTSDILIFVYYFLSSTNVFSPRATPPRLRVTSPCTSVTRLRPR